MPRFTTSICPDCAATLGAGGQATITGDPVAGLQCTHFTTFAARVSTDHPTVALVTIIGMRPQTLAPEIRTVHLTQADIDRLDAQRSGFSAAEWAKACLEIDLEALAEAGDPPQVEHPDDECQCGHTREDHEYNRYQCRECNCIIFKSSDLDMASGQEMQ